MIYTFKEYTLKYTRGPLYKFIKSYESNGSTLSFPSSKKAIKDFLSSNFASPETLKDFDTIWQEYKRL